MSRLIFLIIFLASTGIARSQAPTACPWLNVGTAEHMLDQTATVTVHIDEDGNGTCHFVPANNHSASIDILVSATDTHPCPPDSPKLRALGNEATQCQHDNPPAQRSTLIAGRIRKAFFVVTMTGIADAAQDEPSDPRLANAYAASPIERLAEIVVGNLY